MIAKSIPARNGTRTFATGIKYVQKHDHKRAPEVVGVGLSFTDRVSYASAAEKAAWTHTRGVSSVATASVEMEAIARLSSRCEDPVHHEIIAYAKDEHPTREHMVADAERLLAALDMADHQYVLSVHTDTDDLHAHVIANRVGPDGRANARWNERIIRERVCAEIAAERGWQIVLGRHNRDIVRDHLGLDELPPEPPRRAVEADFARVYERGELPWQDAARPYVLDAVERARSWDDLRERLDAHGVVLKAVERGGRFQGLAFAEGLADDAPGCGASRIDARCKLSALEARFGPYQAPARAVEASREVIPHPTSVTPVVWRDEMRPAILAAVDGAASWSELRERLDEVGVVLKAVERGGRLQGLAFAADEGEDAPGCGASRIDTRCKLSALEARFGAFPERSDRDASEPPVNASQANAPDAEQPEKATSREVSPALDREANARPSEPSEPAQKAAYDPGEGVRERAERKAIGDPEWALKRAQGIADNARLRAEYQEFKDCFYAERREGWSQRREASWNAEKAQRRSESDARWKAKQMQRTVAKYMTGRGTARKLAFDLIDRLDDMRAKNDRARASERWERTKEQLSQRVEQERSTKPHRYYDFVAERAEAGDAGAERVLEYLNKRDLQQCAQEPVRSEPMVEQAKVEEKRGYGAEIADELSKIERALTKRSAEIERERSVMRIVYKPDPLQEQIDRAYAAMMAEVKPRAAQFTEWEKQRLDELEERRQSWNLITRFAAEREVEKITEQHDRREARLIDEAQWAFRQREITRITTAYDRQMSEHRACRDRREELDREQRGVGRDLMAVEEMRQEFGRMGERMNDFFWIGSPHVPGNPHERIEHLRSVFEVVREGGNERGRDDLGWELGIELDD